MEERLALVSPLGDLDNLCGVRPHSQLVAGENQLPIYLDLVAIWDTQSQ